MNKGFSYYFRNGMSLASHSLKGESFLKRFNLLVYFLMSFIGKLFFFTRPIFAIADMNLASMIRECQTFSFSKLFQNTTDGRRYRNLLLFYFIVDLLILCAGVIIIAPSFSLVAALSLSNLDVESTDYAILFYMVYSFVAILVIVFALFAVRTILTYAPAGYIGANEVDTDVSDYLYNSKRGTNGIKFTLFMVNLVYFLIMLAIIAIVCGTIAAIMLFCQYYLAMILSTFIILGFVLLLIYFLQIFIIASLNSNYLIFKYSIPLEKVMVVSETLDNEEKVQTVLTEPTESEEEGEN